jgi:hypothetical protein
MNAADTSIDKAAEARDRRFEARTSPARLWEAVMSKPFMRLTIAFAAICGLTAAGAAMSTYRVALLSSQSCEMKEIARAGGLAYLARQDAWVSARGAVFHVSGCPTLRAALSA